MNNIELLGEYECKIDAKGRMRVPADLLKQLSNGNGGTHTFVVNRGLEKNLMFYPKAVWDGIIKRVSSLNQFDKNHRKFIRYMYRGAQILELDSSDRVLIKKPLLEFAGIEKEVVLFAQGTQVEIWSKENYWNDANEEPNEDMSTLAQQVMSPMWNGNSNQKNFHINEGDE